MSKRAFSEKAANQLLHKALHAPPGDETVAALSQDWRKVLEAHFALTPDQQKVLEAIPPDGSQLIQSTLTTALARREARLTRGVEVHFAQAPPTQTHPVEIRVDRGSIVNGAFNASTAPNELTEDDLAYAIYVLVLAGAIVLGCIANN